MHHPTDTIAHTTAFVTTVVEHWLEREELWQHTINQKKKYQLFVLLWCKILYSEPCDSILISSLKKIQMFSMF